jgi:hypothetical protein
MGELAPVQPVLRLVAITFGPAQALEWVAATAARHWGAIALRSSVFDFNQTTYYEAEMGKNLKKQLIAFEQLVDPGELAKAKLRANQWELEYALGNASDVRRPVNIDPGYLTEAKLVLATTKDRDHRIYLSEGIYAEVTLFFQRGHWQASRWTYPDFQQPAYHDFLTECREHLRRRLADVDRSALSKRS